MEWQHYNGLVYYLSDLKERNDEIRKKIVELEQEFNRNKFEIENTYVEIEKMKNTIQFWEGLK